MCGVPGKRKILFKSSLFFFFFPLQNGLCFENLFGDIEYFNLLSGLDLREVAKCRSMQLNDSTYVFIIKIFGVDKDKDDNSMKCVHQNPSLFLMEFVCLLFSHLDSSLCTSFLTISDAACWDS